MRAIKLFIFDLLICVRVAWFMRAQPVARNKNSTKYCPQCGGEAVALLRSINRKLCTDCKHEYQWNLDPGQKPLLTPARSTPPAEVKRADT